MAENKKSFVLYADLIHTVRKMSKAKAGDLFLTILSYVNDENPTVTDPVVDLVFEPIKQQLKRDLVKWEKFKAKQAENGKKGGRPPKEETQINPENPSLILESQKSLNVSVNDNVNDSVSYSITIGQQKFQGKTSEWLTLNKEGAIETLLMKQEYSKLTFEKVAAVVDSETNQYHFKDQNHPYNYFKSACDRMIRPANNFSRNTQSETGGTHKSKAI